MSQGGKYASHTCWRIHFGQVYFSIGDSRDKSSIAMKFTATKGMPREVSKSSVKPAFRSRRRITFMCSYARQFFALTLWLRGRLDLPYTHSRVCRTKRNSSESRFR